MKAVTFVNKISFSKEREAEEAQYLPYALDGPSLSTEESFLPNQGKKKGRPYWISPQKVDNP